MVSTTVQTGVMIVMADGCPRSDASQPQKTKENPSLRLIVNQVPVSVLMIEEPRWAGGYLEMN